MGPELIASLVEVTGMSVKKFAEQNGFNKTAVYRQLNAGRCRYPRMIHEQKIYHPLFKRWTAIKERCTSPQCQSFKHYGGRGITMCPRWQISFKNFLLDVGEPPSPEHSLDRADNNGNYVPGNLRWATPQEQARNRRIKSTADNPYKGVSLRNGRWVARITPEKGERLNLGSYDTAEEAAAAYDRAARKYFGPSSVLNFPEDLDD